MVQPYNTEDDLKSRLKFLGPNADQWELEDRLLDATLEMDSSVGRTIEEQLRPTREDQREFRLTFSKVFEVVKVEGFFGSGFDEEVDASNYTVTKDPERGGVNISFDQTWAEDNLFSNDYRLRVTYIPDLFRRLELKIAKWDIAVDYSVQTGDSEAQARAEKVRQRKESLMKSINRTTQNLGDKDAGDTLAANYNFPGQQHP